MADPHRKARRRLVRFGAVVATAALTVGAVGATAGATTTRTTHRQGGGGNVNFGLEAETTDYCLSRAQLAISGIQVVAAVYDTLTVPNSKGVPTPYLAKSVTPNPNFSQWTIALRPGINFQDGTPFNAAAVKLNLDTYRGAPSGVAAAEGPLFTIYLGFIQDVSVVDPMTVQVTLKTPVADFPSYLYSTGRMGMMAPSQLNGNCSTGMVGTGPFKLQSYQQNQKTVVVKNPSYWQAGYPKASSITFFPIDDEAARTNQLEGGQLDLLHTSSALQLSTLKTQSQLKLLTQPPGFREIHYYWLISNKPPFNSQTARTAFAEAVNRQELNTIRNKGLFDVANSLMDKNAPGYLANAGYPAFNLQRAQTLVNQVKAANGGQFNITLGATTDPEASAEAQLLKEELGKAGINATIAQFDQATLINKALQGSIDVLIWRNLHGEYSDFSDQSTYVWFANANLGFLTNFGRYNDADTQALLDQGRAITNPAQDKAVYQKFNQTMAAKGYLLPTWFVAWTIASTSSTHVTFPPLPDGHGNPLFEYGRIPVLGLSKS